jgi:gluconate 2-dehydrogenase gamma chain
MEILNRVDASIVLDGESASSYSRKSEDFRPFTMNELNRRNFLLRAGTGLSAAWISANWPALLSAATHAHNAAKAATPPKFEFFTPEEAAEVEAITVRLIPTDDTPGAREAGVVYFIDRGLTTFWADDQKTYREGLPGLQVRVSEMFPSVSKFYGLTAEQQDAVLDSFDENIDAPSAPRRAFRARPGAQNFFETLRQHTINGFLIDPDYGGNHDGVGWKVIGREREHMFQAPFGYYDKDYPGWQPEAKEAEKK